MLDLAHFRVTEDFCVTSFITLIDDLRKDVSTLEGLQKNALMGGNGDGPFMQAFRENLLGLYQFYETVPSNCITLSAFDFVNGTLLEQIPSVRDMKLSDCTQSWPNYLRNKTGCSGSYAFMIFPKTLNVDVSAYVATIGDIISFINTANDILS